MMCTDILFVVVFFLCCCFAKFVFFGVHIDALTLPKQAFGAEGPGATNAISVEKKKKSGGCVIL